MKSIYILLDTVARQLDCDLLIENGTANCSQEELWHNFYSYSLPWILVSAEYLSILNLIALILPCNKTVNIMPLEVCACDLWI